MRRRDFLSHSGRVVAGTFLLPLTSCAPRTMTGAKSGPGSAAWIAELQRLIPRLMEETKVPGVSIALIKDTKLHWRGAFGIADRESGRPVDHETVFEAASVSKTVFAYAALKLCEQGVIGLDTPLTKYATRPFVEGDKRLDLITPRMVLSHTAGFQDWRSEKEPLKIHFTPGERYSYSGEGYFYLQSVMTQLKGKSNPHDCSRYEQDLEVCATDIDSYMKANLLVPFGMTSSGYVWNEALEKHAARPHDAEGKPLKKKKPRATDAARYASAGGLHTTPTDYAKFLIEVVRPKKSDAFRLSRESLKEMVRPQVMVDDSSSWALGWQIRHAAQRKLIEHSGYNPPGFHCFTSVSIERQSGFILMTNAENGWKIYSNPAFANMLMPFVAG